jgi:hypothetical protein
MHRAKIKVTDEQRSLLTWSLRLTIHRSDDCAPVHRWNQIPPEGKTTDEIIFLDPVGKDGVWVMESSYTGTIRQTTIRDGTLIQNPTVQPGPYIQGVGGALPTVVSSPQGTMFCARSTWCVWRFRATTSLKSQK